MFRRRRRNLFFITAISALCVYLYLKRFNTCLINCKEDKDAQVSLEALDSSRLDQHTLQEIARLDTLNVEKAISNKKVDSNIRNKNIKNRIDKEMLEKYKKYQDDLKRNDDPFRKIEPDYVDFQNFRTDFVETKYKPEDLKPIVGSLNARQIMHNAEKFSTNRSKDHIVIVVQVHKRIEYFKELLDSLQRAKSIENAILVVSHDFYSDTMNELIRRISFCQVIQIFFPYALQLYPNEYPGQSPDDCARDMKKDDAMKMGCANAEYPDQYGHYREAHITMTKHHWWWKINMVMDELEVTRHHDGPFMLIEEDHYLAPSFYDAMMMLHHLKKTDPRCRNSCEVLTLGNYSDNNDFKKDGDKVFHGTWISSQHNMGMAFYRNTWEQIRECASEFCNFDDYNWDWTLMHLSLTCMEKPLSVLVYVTPRMYHVGDCGLHHTKSCDNSKDSLNKVKLIIAKQKPYLFQNRLRIISVKPGAPSVKANGGWGDKRDQDLCQSFVRFSGNIMK